MIRKGIDWVDRMKIGKLSRTDAWMSLFAQLLLGNEVGTRGSGSHTKGSSEILSRPLINNLSLLGANRNLGKE